MRTCPKCNTKNKEGAKFCTQCGYPFGLIIRTRKLGGGGGSESNPLDRPLMDPITERKFIGLEKNK